MRLTWRGSWRPAWRHWEALCLTPVSGFCISCSTNSFSSSHIPRSLLAKSVSKPLKIRSADLEIRLKCKCSYFEQIIWIIQLYSSSKLLYMKIWGPQQFSISAQADATVSNTVTKLQFSKSVSWGFLSQMIYSESRSGCFWSNGFVGQPDPQKPGGKPRPAWPQQLAGVLHPLLFPPAHCWSCSASNRWVTSSVICL